MQLEHSAFPPPFIALLQLVVEKFKGRPDAEIKHRDVEDLHFELKLSDTTIKRLYGIDKVKEGSKFRQSTKDILAQYIGYKNYAQFEREFNEKEQEKERETQSEPQQQSSRTRSVKPKKKLKKLDYHYLKALIESSQQLHITLEKILNNEASYLNSNARINDIQNYWYCQTLYDFCALLGWLTLFEQLFAEQLAFFPNLGISIFDLRDALDRHPEVHYQQLMHLCILWELETYWLTSANAKDVGHEVEKVIEKYCIQYGIQQAEDLENVVVVKQNLLSDVSNVLYKAIPYPMNPISWKMLEEKSDRAIQKLFQIQAWLFYSWQNGVAEFMIQKDKKRKNKRFTVINFSTFEDSFLDKSSPQYRWIERVEAIFSDLNVNKPAKYDARIVQIQQMYDANKCLLQTLKAIDV